ncbi:hypothetical protein Fmac_020462 [Flemingia macrophylla]|uniref:Wall-associated receptor kinase galacturonan-binding domain-containing protein n=1 Tax=Flemingia macrophylla TaxID=520843 RepID=A0ABD1LVW9_9FABA
MYLLYFNSRCAQSTTVATVAVIIFALFHQTGSAKDQPSCPPFSCGKIHNLSYPFRAKGDPPGCGLQKYELECLNNVTVLNLFAGKYHVQEIDYKRYQIRVVDAGVVEDTPCSFPRYFLYLYNFSADVDIYRYSSGIEWYGYQSIALLECSNPVSDDPRYVQMDTAPCHSGGGGHVYAILQSNYDYPNRLGAIDVKVGCRLKVATLANFIKYSNDSDLELGSSPSIINASYADIRKWLKDGFWLTWLNQVTCTELCGGKDVGCYLNYTTEQVQCNSDKYCYFVKNICDGDLPRIGEYIRRKIDGFIRIFAMCVAQLIIGNAS